MPKNRYQGMFKPVQAGFKVPPSFSITEAQGFLHAVAEASARHRVGRTYTDESELTFADEGGTHLKVVGAGSEDEFWDQVAQLTRAFTDAEGRPPTYRDDNFWQAVNVLHDAYEGPEIGSLDSAFEPFVGHPA
jgi:hypothetical protein